MKVPSKIMSETINRQHVVETHSQDIKQRKYFQIN